MEYRVLGKTGLKVSRVGLGGLPLQRVDAEATKELVKSLLENDINFIDTARGNTVSVEYLGYGMEGIRDKFVLATKSMARTKDAMAADIEISLKNLRTDYIDLYQLHNVKNVEALEAALKEDGAYRALKEAQAEGKIRHIGITSHIKDTLIYAIKEHADLFSTIMYPYNIVETEGEDLFRLAKEADMGTMAMKPMGGGNLSDAKLALRFIVQNPNIDVALVGIGDKKDALEDTQLDLSALTEEEIAKCKAIREELGTEFCRRCNYCAPCTVGIDIPTNFTFHNYLKNYDLATWAKERYAAMPVRADSCIGCGVCETRCPYELKIREKLAVVAKDFAE